MKFQRLLSHSVFFLLAAGMVAAQDASVPPPDQKERSGDITDDVTQGSLRVVTKDHKVVECPLKHTDVQVEISGFIARVKVTQTFYNPLTEKIEAVYVFPLPHESAVDEMTMVVGERRIVGVIKRRAEARRIYEQALRAGQTTALLEQERPNIFTQSVGNIKPKQEVKVEIGYIDVLQYDQGDYEFHFPMVVGPRFIPGAPASVKAPVPPELAGKVADVPVPAGQRLPRGTGWSPDTGDVPDASRITPPVLKPGFRTGHDISLHLKLDAGVPIQGLKSINHKAEMERTGPAGARVVLSREDSIPNKDFVLRYGVMGRKPEKALLCHTDGQSGYFLLMIQPGEDEKLRKSPPREIVFMIDISGSMSGRPIAKCREAMEKLLGLVREKDTIQVITFRGNAAKLFERPLPATKNNITRALAFSQGLQGSGGTRMLEGVQMAINEPIDRERMRIVIMLTDGYIGNEAQIIEAVGKGCGDQIRFWCMGIGNSVNRFLVDGVARQGGGMGKVVSLNEDPGATVEEFMTRIQRAQLSRIQIDWGGMETSEIYPARIPDLWAGRPVILYGLYRLSSGGKTHGITISGLVEGDPVSWPLEVTVPARAGENLALSRVWARKKIEDLMHQTYYAGSPEVEEAVTAIALEYRLMSQYTSFVAVDESELPNMAGQARPPRRMLVPVPMPEGVSYEGVFGGRRYDSYESGGAWGFRPGRASSSGLGLMKMEARLGQASQQLRVSNARTALPLNRSRQLSRKMYGGTAPAGPAGGAARASRSRSLSPTREAVVRLRDRRSSPEAARVLSESLAEMDGLYAPRLQFQILAGNYQELQKRLPLVLKKAGELKESGKLLEAREEFIQAYLLDAALQGAGRSDGSISAEALAGMEEINRELLKTWKREMPALEKKLDLVLRNLSLPEALAEVARSSGLELRELEGSIPDSAALLGRKDVRVTYLDLRNATAAQALDWILIPARLTWQVVTDGGRPAVLWGSGRRDPRLESAWVYDVSHLALPLAEEMEKEKVKEKDPKKQLDIFRRSLEDFLSALQGTVGLHKEDLAWYGPGQLLLVAGREKHLAAANFFERMADPAARVAGDLEALHGLTSARARKGAENRAKLQVERERAEVLEQLTGYAWPLLSRAAAGSLHDEALTELEIAWRSPRAAELLKGAGALPALRATWAVSETARTLKNARAERLSGLALKLARPGAESALASLEKNPENWDQWMQVFYSALAYRNDDEFLARARRALLNTSSGKTQLAAARSFVRALLDREVDPGAVAAAFENRNPAGASRDFALGDDRVVLAALACRKAGGEAWRSFRAEAGSLLGNQPLSGGVVVLVNRLSGRELAILRP